MGIYANSDDSDKKLAIAKQLQSLIEDFSHKFPKHFRYYPIGIN